MALKFFVTITVFFIVCQCYTLNNSDGIIFYFYKKNQERISLNENNSDSFVPTTPTKVIVHGFNVGANSTWVISMAKSYIKKENCNVLTIDWSKVTDNKIVNIKIEKAASVVADGILYLASKTSNLTKNLKNFHFVGHSMGAHLSGEVGEIIYNQVNVKLFRITGLDPAQPAFDNIVTNNAKLLRKSDADFVDVMHTSAVFGYPTNLGHADFYVNGGDLQPQCYGSTPCSHSAAHSYFIKSITAPDYFIGTVCKNWRTYQMNKCVNNTKAVMGEFTPAETRGTFYVKTDYSLNELFNTNSTFVF